MNLKEVLRKFTTSFCSQIWTVQNTAYNRYDTYSPNSSATRPPTPFLSPPRLRKKSLKYSTWHNLIEFLNHLLNFNRSRENTGKLCQFVKNSILICGVEDEVWYITSWPSCHVSILLVSLNNPPRQLLSYGRKIDPSKLLTRFLSADRGFREKSIFLKSL